MLPLEGITVVALEQAVAAPFATRQLADLGARVIKIERPGAGDFARGYEEAVRGISAHHVWLNRSKESLTLDLKHPAAAAIIALKWPVVAMGLICACLVGYLRPDIPGQKEDIGPA